MSFTLIMSLTKWKLRKTCIISLFRRLWIWLWIEGLSLALLMDRLDLGKLTQWKEFRISRLSLCIELRWVGKISFFKKSGKKFDFYISFFEIYGGRLYDLLNNKAKLTVLEDKNQKVQIFGLESKKAENPDEMCKLIDLGNSIRTTHNTVTNEVSSRSHSICNVT